MANGTRLSSGVYYCEAKQQRPPSNRMINEMEMNETLDIRFALRLLRRFNSIEG